MNNPQILNIGRSREKAVYFRPNGTQTGLLPADSYSQQYYINKGFSLKAPKKATEGLIGCPLCEFEAKSAFGLQAHLRIHTKEEK